MVETAKIKNLKLKADTTASCRLQAVLVTCCLESEANTKSYANLKLYLLSALVFELSPAFRCIRFQLWVFSFRLYYLYLLLAFSLQL
jgi:hypothetical protein